ncbi:MAG TPA: hypothetical protein VNX26_07715 [Candidatus Acidoferrum sp.]|nr:hypothetical protein [Candidatus Acidoferrum sp.]
MNQGKTKAEYEALILSRVLDTKVQPGELSSDPYYSGFLSSFSKSREKGTFYFDKAVGCPTCLPGTVKVRVGVPEWLEDVLNGKGGVTLGPGASLQNCPNGNCTAGESTRVDVTGNENVAGSVRQVGDGNASQIGSNNSNTQITVGALTPEQRKRKNAAHARIGQLIEEGGSLMQQCLKAEDKADELAPHATKWATEVISYLKSIDDSGDAATFNNITGLTFSHANVAPHNDNVWNYLNLRVQALADISKQFRD